MNPDAALAQLRLTTRADHDRIEDVLRLTEPMSLARYAAILQGFDAFLAAWEPRVHGALPASLQPWFDARRRGRFARADVAWLRDAAGMAPQQPQARAASVLPLVDVAQVLGSLYVIEGSALGGRVIAPRLEATLGLGPGHGASYFHGFGEQTGAMWRDFRALVSREIGDSPQAIERACASARDTFEAMIELFAPLAAGGAHGRADAATSAPEPLRQPGAAALPRATARDSADPGSADATRLGLR